MTITDDAAGIPTRPRATIKLQETTSILIETDLSSSDQGHAPPQCDHHPQSPCGLRSLAFTLMHGIPKRQPRTAVVSALDAGAMTRRLAVSGWRPLRRKVHGVLHSLHKRCISAAN